METPGTPAPPPPIDPARRAKVDAAREAWIRALIDKSRRNNLLYYRDLKTGSLDLTGADERAVARLLKQEDVALSKLLPDSLDPRVAEAKLLEIRQRALMNAEERGIETLFLAMGMASWTSPDGERPPEAAILLVPIQVDPRGRSGQGCVVRRKGDIQPNLVLLHVLETEFGVALTPADLIAALSGDDPGEPFDASPVNERLRQAARDVPGFTTSERLVIGNFAFQKTAMVRDLREYADRIAEHDLISALAGDSGAANSVRERRVNEDPAEIDRTPPDNEFLFLDADSSQQLVVRNVLGLQDGTIQGPPGTGKSQTIANLIAEFAARGKRVLFVAEKRAALEVVRERLRKAGLDHLALDLHGAEISRRDVMTRVQASLDRIGTVLPVPSADAHRRLIDRRNRLSQHVRRLHAVCAPTGRSVYDVQGRLLRLDPAIHSKTRWTAEALDRLDAHAIEQATGYLSELQELRDLFLRCSTSPWTGAELIDGPAVRRALALAKELSSEWPASLSALQGLCDSNGLGMPPSLDGVAQLLGLVADLEATFEIYDPRLFADVDLHETLDALQPAKQSALGRAWQFVVNSGYRRALSVVRSHLRGARRSPAKMLDDIANALARADLWATFATTSKHPQPCPTGAAVRSGWDAMQPRVHELAALLSRDDLGSLAPAEMGALLDALVADPRTPPQIPGLLTHERALETLGVGDFVKELREVRPPADEFVPQLEHAWLTSALDRVMDEDVDFASFRGRSHDRVVEEFRALDRERIKLAADRVRRAHAEQAVHALNTFREEADLVRRECQKKMRGMGIRTLLTEAPHVLTSLLPCWMASPLSVSHLLPVDQGLFDIVLFDEASQVLPQDAVPALLRARSAVVAGDRHQLPPTTFFLPEEELDAEVDEEAPTQGFESILDLMSGLFEPWTLDWHYRSRDESLISFSNRHIYSNRLVTFPGPGRHRSVEHHHVEMPPIDGQEDSVSAEAAKVVELIMRHATERPADSLGVITLGVKHQQRIERALAEARRDHPELDAFFDESRRERFFVKNLERVQGDERDAIILSVGYGKDRSGKLPYRFGPLLSDGGERRLNVAITRARNSITLVSSFGHGDMDPGRSKARGVELLRLYLQFAASGGANLGDAQTPAVALNDFEQGVSDALTANGIQLMPQWGASKYRIDLVAKHPSREGRLVLAIECDGATYHSAQSARDRDRLRQQHLEALGWRFHRIWSTDWFNNREDELERAIRAYEEAVRAADREDAAEPSRTGAPDEGSVETAPSPRAAKRATRPDVPRKDTIEKYSDAELVRMVAWIESDGRLRTDEQVIDELVDELGFERRGSRIVARIEEAIAMRRRGKG